MAYENVNAVSSDFWGKPVLRNSNGDLYCPGFVGETYARHIWDLAVFLGTKKTPGVCEVKVTKAQDADVKKAAGSDGATITTHGVRPAEIIIAVKLWTPDQWEKMKSLWKEIMPRPGKKEPEAVDVFHPVLDAHGIKSMLVTRGEGPAPSGSPAVKVFTIHGLEFFKTKKKKATKTPVASKGSVYDPGRLNNGQVAPRALPGAGGKNTGPT